MSDRWLAFSPSTVRETRGSIERYLRPTFGTTDVAKLRTDDIDRFYRSLRAGHSKSGRPLKPGTIRRIHVILRRAVAQGVKWGWIRTNPAASASPPRVPVGEIVRRRRPTLAACLSHYVATQLLAAGVDVRTVAGRLGHRSASTTLNVYSHFLPEADRAASEVLASLLPARVTERPV